MMTATATRAAKKQLIGLDQQNHNFARASRFFNFCIFLYYCCSNATVKLPGFTFYGGRENKTDNSFPFHFLNLRLISTDAFLATAR